MPCRSQTAFPDTIKGAFGWNATKKEDSMKDTIRQIAVVLTVLGTLIVNYLAVALPLNGLNTGAISDQFKVYFVPAGYVFSIWGIIYLGLIAYAVFQALPSQRENPRLRRTGWWISASGLANMAWLFAWHYEQFLITLPVMLVLLAVLIVTYLNLGIGESGVSRAETWAVRVPFSIYLGWISVATIANATELLDFLHWDGFGIAPKTWAVILMVAVVVIAGLMSYLRRDIAYNAVIVWALIGIAVKNSGARIVSYPALAAALIVALVLVYCLWQQRKKV
jgi:translocator protein